MQDDGAPLIDHLVAAQKRTGRVPDLLANAPVLPEQSQGIWADFLELHGSRDYLPTEHGAIPRALSFLEIDAWQRVNGIHLTNWELSTLRKIDDAFLRSHRSR